MFKELFCHHTWKLIYCGQGFWGRPNYYDIIHNNGNHDPYWCYQIHDHVHCIKCPKTKNIGMP